MISNDTRLVLSRSPECCNQDMRIVKMSTRGFSEQLTLMQKVYNLRICLLMLITSNRHLKPTVAYL